MSSISSFSPAESSGISPIKGIESTFTSESPRASDLPKLSLESAQISPKSPKDIKLLYGELTSLTFGHNIKNEEEQEKALELLAEVTKNSFLKTNDHKKNESVG